MAKIGINLRIDVTKIDKSRLYKGAKGTYLDVTTFIDTSQADQYGNHGFISQSTTKEEREQGVQTPILGNSKVFYSDMDASLKRDSGSQPQQQNQGGFDDFDSDIPFSNYELRML